MLRLSTLALAALLPLSALAAPQTYTLDPQHSYPNFAVNHLGMSTIQGRFDKMSGKVVFDAAAKTGSLDVKIAVASVTTGLADRDAHLRTADFFNTAEFPEASYKSSKFNFKGDTLESIDGTLTLLGVSKPVKLSVAAFKCGAHPFTKAAMCGGDATTSFKRTDFGIKYGVPAIGDEVKLTIGFEAYPQ